MLKVLFVCGRNKRRSPTAEAIFRDDPRLNVRSGGTSQTSARRVTQKDLEWASLICVMEPKYEARLRANFTELERWPEFKCLNIPDEYERMAPELVVLLKSEIDVLLEDLGSD